MGINLRQNKIVGSSAYGKYYPEVDQQKTLSLRGFAKHMTDHGSLYGRAIVEGVLMQITDCLPELVAQGVPVQLGNLGTFYPTAEVAKNGAVNDIPDMDGLNPNDIVKAIHIRFLPDATKLDNLCITEGRFFCYKKLFRHKTFKTLWVSERLKCLICLTSFLEKHTSEGSEREEDC